MTTEAGDVEALLATADFQTLKDVYEGIMRPRDLKEGELWQVRLWDGMDGVWCDVEGAMQPLEALKVWFRNTNGGSKNVQFGEIDYYRIFSANTTMAYSAGHEMFRGDDPKPPPTPMPLAKTKPRGYWNLTHALGFIQTLERGLSQVGWHVGLGGSVLHAGESFNDLDIIVFPHRLDWETNAAYGASGSSKFDVPRKTLESYGMKLEVSAEDVRKKWAKADGSSDLKHVEVWRWHTYKVDVFFLR